MARRSLKDSTLTDGGELTPEQKAFAAGSPANSDAVSPRSSEAGVGEAGTGAQAVTKGRTSEVGGPGMSPARASNNRASRRRGRQTQQKEKQVNIDLPPELHRDLKLLAVNLGVPLKNVAAQFIRTGLKRQQKKLESEARPVGSTE